MHMVGKCGFRTSLKLPYSLGGFKNPKSRSRSQTVVMETLRFLRHRPPPDRREFSERLRCKALWEFGEACDEPVPCRKKPFRPPSLYSFVKQLCEGVLGSGPKSAKKSAAKSETTRLRTVYTSV
jgi:hypothetical protein